MTKYIKPETTVVTIDNGRLLAALSYNDSYESDPTKREDLAKPNTKSNGWETGSLW